MLRKMNKERREREKKEQSKKRIGRRKREPTAQCGPSSRPPPPPVIQSWRVFPYEAEAVTSGRSQNIKDGEPGEWWSVPANGGARALPLPPAAATAHAHRDAGT